MRALIVDDEPTVCLLLSRILARDFDCVASEARNGVEALDLLSRQRYDFMLLDLLMPVMSGFETLEAIRADPDLQHLPVMVLSTVREERRVREAIGLGISTYMTKPLRPADVSERLVRFVSTLGGGVSGRHVERSVAGLQPGARLLVVDGDRDFRHFVKSTLGHQYLVSQAASGAQGLRMAIEQQPAAILLGRDLGALTATTFLLKLRGLPAVAGVPVIGAVSGRAESPLAGLDAVIDRTFIPENFSRQFERLLAGDSPEARVLRQRPALRTQLISATEQVFGMMLALEVFAEPSAVVGVPGHDVASIPITLADSPCDLEVRLSASRASTEGMARRMLQATDVTADDATATLQELTNMLAGRVLNGLRAAGDQAELGLPTSTTWPPEALSTEHDLAVAFGCAADALSFAVTVRSVSREP